MSTWEKPTEAQIKTFCANCEHRNNANAPCRKLLTPGTIEAIRRQAKGLGMLGEAQKDQEIMREANKMSRFANIRGVTARDAQINMGKCDMASVSGAKGTMRPTGFTEDGLGMNLYRKLLRLLH